MACNNCNDGFIKEGTYPNEKVKICICTYWEESKKAYVKSGGEERFTTFKPFELTNIEIKDGNYQPLSLLSMMKSMTANFENMIQTNTFVYFVGENGTGKTQTAHSLVWTYLYTKAREQKPPKAHNLLEKVMFLSAHTIKNFVFDFEKKNRFYEKLTKADILVIDDLGAEMRIQDNATQRVMEEWDMILRGFTGLVLITTNALVFAENIETGKQEADIIAKGRKMYPDKRLKSVLGKWNKKIYLFDGKNMRKTPQNSFLDTFQ